VPNRNPTATPTIIAGTVLESGTPNTGQVMYSDGGNRLNSVFSGTAGGDANHWVGAGRLDSAFYHGQTVLALSGQFVTFYDAAAAVSGGPLATSGHKIVAVLGFGNFGNASGNVYTGGDLVKFGTVFTSGLCYASRSGQLGFSVCYTPVISG
jgi:hypothetical protein